MRLHTDFYCLVKSKSGAKKISSAQRLIYFCPEYNTIFFLFLVIQWKHIIISPIIMCTVVGGIYMDVGVCVCMCGLEWLYIFCICVHIAYLVRINIS